MAEIEQNETGWMKFAGIAVLAAVAGYGIFTLGERAGGGSISLPGLVEVTINEDDNFGAVLEKAIIANAGQVENLLAGQNYYKLTSINWVNKLRQVELEADVGAGLRQLLYDLAGPFEKTMALAGADIRLLEAVAELKAKADRSDPEDDIRANGFLAAILRDSLEQKGVFDLKFNADVVLRNDTEDPNRAEVYACRTSVFVGKEITLLFNRDDESEISNIFSGIVRPISNCSSERTLEELIARKRERIGLSVAAFEQLYGPVGAGETLPPRLSAEFEVLPLNSTTRIALTE